MLAEEVSIAIAGLGVIVFMFGVGLTIRSAVRLRRPSLLGARLQLAGFGLIGIGGGLLTLTVPLPEARWAGTFVVLTSVALLALVPKLRLTEGGVDQRVRPGD